MVSSLVIIDNSATEHKLFDVCILVFLLAYFLIFVMHSNSHIEIILGAYFTVIVPLLDYGHVFLIHLYLVS